MRLRIEEADAGRRVDAVLADALGSRSRAQRLIADGAVRVDGRPVRKGRKLVAGEVIEVEDRPADPEPDQVPAPDFVVAWEDEHVVVVDKPAGLVVHPGAGHLAGTLAQALEARYPPPPDAGEDWRGGLVHRLDRDTSGLLIAARTVQARDALQETLRNREIEREYVALVQGRPPARSGTIDAPIGRDRRVRTRMSTDTDMGREARTHFEALEALPSSTLLRVRLETGRTHQIRAHFKAIGHPVAGDPEYGSAGLFGLERQFLHAARLAFPHPASGERIEVESQLPDDLAAALQRAREAGAR
jgi:23S rRNA pseudouridine1911/1915/1917 synthase